MQPALAVLDAMESTLDVSVCKAAFPAIAREVEAQTWTRDPFDRLTVAQAALLDAPLVTKDATIHANYARAIWD